MLIPGGGISNKSGFKYECKRKRKSFLLLGCIYKAATGATEIELNTVKLNSFSFASLKA
jgi:hypothetical protein